MKYKEGTFGYFWTVTNGNEDIENEVYKGDIECTFIGLTSLKGAPEEIQGNFDCSNNQLTTLEYVPNIIDGYFDCSFNKLKLLDYTLM